MRHAAIVLAAALVAALQASDPPQCCQTSDGCLPHSPIFGPCAQPCTCPGPTPTPTPSPQASGTLKWLPPDTNYVEGPWALKKDNRVWIGGHSGYCCQDYLPDGRRAHDSFWSIVTWFGPYRPVWRAQTLADASLYDDHESGSFSPLFIGGQWMFFGSRTERSYWGQGNRLRPFRIDTTDPVMGDLIIDRTPLFYPREPACHEMGDVSPVCTNSIGTGQHGGALTTRDGRVLVLVKDDVNRPLSSPSLMVIFELDLVLRTSRFVRSAYFGPNFWPSISDWARGRDGRFYAYGGDTPITDWYNSKSILEWVSDDEGANWTRTGRSWPAAPGYALWDAGVMRDAGGVIAEPLTLVALTCPYGEWATDGHWRMWWWTADRKALPPMFGQDPNARLIRRRI